MISNLHFEDLGKNTNMILMLIINRCVGQGKPHCAFSMVSFRDRTNLSKERIQASIKQLADRGYLSIIRVPMGGYVYYLDGASMSIYTDEIDRYSGIKRF